MTTTMKERPTAAASRQRIDNLPEVRARLTRLSELRNELTSVQEEIREARRAEGVSVEDQARRLIDGQADQAAPSERIRLLSQRVPVLRRAIDLQEEDVRNAQMKASREVATEALPAYRNLIERMAAVAVELGKLADEEQEFRDDLERRGVSFLSVFPALPLRSMQLRVHGSTLNRWLDSIASGLGMRIPVKRAGCSAPPAPRRKVG